MRVVVSTFSGYADVLNIFCQQLAKLWPDEEPSEKIEFVVLADRSDFVQEAFQPVVGLPQFVLRDVVVYREEEPFWKKLMRLSRIRLGPAFLFLQEDFLLYDTPDWNRIISLKKLLASRARRYSFLRLVPSGHESPNLKTLLVGKETFFEVNHETRYRFSWQATLWRPMAFFAIHLIARPHSIRQENNRHYCRAMRWLQSRGLCSPHHELPYVLTAVRAKQWDYTANPGGDKLEAILQDYGIDTSIRGIRRSAPVKDN